MHVKLNEILAALEGASNRLINVEESSEEEVAMLHQHFKKVAELARREKDLTSSHSIEETTEHQNWNSDSGNSP